MYPTSLLVLPVLASIILHVAIATTNATNCEPAKCGNLTVMYPFSLAGKQPLDCGYLPFQLSCDEANRTYLTRTFREHLYRVAEIFYENSSMVVAVETIFRGDSNCSVPDFNINSSLSLFPLSVNATNKNLIFVYDCNLPPPGRAPELSLLSCGVDKRKMGAYLTQEWDGKFGNNSNVPQYLPNNCSFQIVPVRGFGGANASRYEQLIRDGFLLEWYALGDCRTCEQIGGQCRFSGEKVQFLCFCPHGGAGLRCTNSTSGGKDRYQAIKIAAIATGGLCLMILCSVTPFLYKRRKRKRSASLDRLIRDGTPMASLRKDLTVVGSPHTHIFTYDELEAATGGFSDDRELGVGGFGTVYKGTLREGSVVAVKRLYKNSYKSVEQFHNEVDILSRLRHPNLVTLYGCTSLSSSRDLLLVYEFVPNGTLADHLHGGLSGAQPITWATRLDIAIETASALDYLHAVEPQVIHRDVKTNNILLDDGFHVKVADFGLSRLFPPDATHVSTAPQGTPGYVDPMYHRCYQLTDKSDVYSFGVVLVELISSKPAVDMKRDVADVNLANMAVSMILSYEIDQLVDPRLGYRSDSYTRRTVDAVAEVAFRCLQPERDVRPPIRDVLEALRALQKMETDVCMKEDAHLLKKSRVYSPDTVTCQWTSNSTTASNTSR